MKLKITKPNIKIPKIKIYGIDVIKNFLFFTLYIFITLLAIAIFIAPSIKHFKKNQNEYYKIKAEYTSVKNQYNLTLNSLNKLKKQNAKIINAFRRDFDEKNFKLFAEKFMKIKTIKKDKTKPYKNDFLKTTYYVKATINSPKNFYDFIDALKNYKYIIRVYFPIDFTKKNKNIELTLKIEHYRLKNKNALKAEEKAH